ncbi:MAG: type II secretion system protein, partial [Candidatus Gracilibacteria bacterium]|nr:type II secretion system protein [Candidatus Gracilibacteria bacterium]
MFRKKIKKGFTLIEILIAASLFVVVTTMTTMILFDIINTEKRTNILSAVYDDARVVMEQIATMIHENAIDYDEYYSVNVIQHNTGVAYGMYHGVYSGRFYDPGLTYDNLGVGKQGENPENLGVECSDVPPPPSISECKIIYKSSKDKNTGKNPYEGSGDDNENTGNAFCDENVSPAGAGGCSNYKTSENHALAVHDELFLLSPDGTKKTIIAKMASLTNNQPTPDFSIGILELIGMDSDQNGMVDLFTCATDYSCDSTPAKIASYLVTPLAQNPFPGILDQTDIPAGFSIS